MSGCIRCITAETFAKDVINSRKPVLVWFDAPWAPVPRAFRAMVYDFAKQYGQRVLCVKVDVRSELDELIRWFRLAAFPAFLLFENGAVSDTAIGTASAKRILQNFAL